MSKGWNYAELSKLASECGGPEKLVEVLVNSGKKQMMPWVGVAIAGGALLTVGVQKVINYFADKKISDEEVELAKQELIQGIKEYDAQTVSCEEGDEENGK